MKTARTGRWIAGLALVLWPALACASGLKLSPASRLWLEGDSTLHPYKCEATTLNAAFAWKAVAPGSSLEAALALIPASLTIRIPVAGLKSAHGGLDKNLRKALKADKHPDIVFLMADYQVDRSSGAAQVVAQGKLTIAGVERAESIRATLRERDGALTLDGEQPLLMTDFGVKPPTALLGTIKAENRVVVRFHLELEREAL